MRKGPENVLLRRARGDDRGLDRIDDPLKDVGRSHHGGARQLVGEAVRYQDAYRLCYIRGPEGLLIGLARNSPERS
jgi:hypothetical protein